MAIPSVNIFSQQPGGGLVTAMQGTNALAKNMMETSYYPATMQAQIAAQNAYAQNMPLQNLATVLSNPNLYAGADKSVINGLLDRYAQLAANPPSVQSMAGGNQLSGGLLSKFMSALTGGNGSQQQQPQPFAQPQPQPMQQGGAPQQPPAEYGQATIPKHLPRWPRNSVQDEVPISEAGTDVVDSIPGAGESSTPGLPSTKVERIAAANGAGGQKYGGVNPSTISNAQTKGLEATATGEAGSQVEQQKKMEVDDIAHANEAVQQKQLLQKAKELHSKIPQWQRGKVFGNITPDILTGSEATELDTTMQNIVASVKKQQESGNAGVEGIKLATSSKPNRAMPDDAFNHLIDYNDAMNDRIMEKPAFNQAMYNKGYTPAQVATMWLYYQSEKPFYDPKHHIKDDANIGTWDKFYATPGRRDAAFSPTAAKQIEKVMGTKQEKAAQAAEAAPQDKGVAEGVIQDTRTVNGKQALKINGEWVWAPE